MEKWFRGQQKGAAYKEEHLDGFESVSVQHFVRSCKLHLRVKGHGVWDGKIHESLL